MLDHAAKKEESLSELHGVHNLKMQNRVVPLGRLMRPMVYHEPCHLGKPRAVMSGDQSTRQHSERFKECLKGTQASAPQGCTGVPS